MTVLRLFRWRASLDPGPITWDWPPRTNRHIYNGRFPR